MNKNGIIASNSRSSLKIVQDLHSSKLLLQQKKVGKKIVFKHLFVLNREPQFSLEKSNEKDCEYVRLTSTNKLVGLLKDGRFERRDEVEKLFFLEKLQLKPREKKENGYYLPYRGFGRNSLHLYDTMTGTEKTPKSLDKDLGLHE